MSPSRRVWFRQAGALLLVAALPAGCGGLDAEVLRAFAEELDPVVDGLVGFDESRWASPVDLDERLQRLAVHVVPRRTPGMPLRSFLQALVRQEHLDGQVVERDGWVLSVTEDMLLDYASARHAGRGSTARRPPPTLADAIDGEVARVDAWGPHATCVGQSFNAQSDGHSSLWITLQETAPAGVVVGIGSRVVRTTRSGALLTTRIDGRLFDEVTGRAAALPVWLFDPHAGRRQQVGMFHVHEGDEAAMTEDGQASSAFRRVAAWGPQESPVGEGFNIQPDGSSAFWIQSRCAPPQTEIFLGTQQLRATVSMDLLTANLVDQAGRRGDVLPLVLRDPLSGERVLVGHFTWR